MEEGRTSAVPVHEATPMIPIEHSTDHTGGPLRVPRPALFTRERYVVVLTWSFTFFSSVRVLSYLPTLWVIWQAQDSTQHSLMTWLTWLGANLTMAGWLHEHNGRRVNKAVAVNLINAFMCLTVVTVIALLRIDR
jgi:hypothetical protein